MNKKDIVKTLLLFVCLFVFLSSYTISLSSINENTKNSFDSLIVLKIGDPNATINDAKYEIDPGRGTVPYILNSRTMLPLRFVIESMGGEVGWNGAEKKVSININGSLIELWINKKSIKIDGQEKQIDTAPVIVNARTFVPIRFVVENAGINIAWDDATKTVTIGEIASLEAIEPDNNLLKANEKFAFDIFKDIANEDLNKDIFISPLSISSALTMTYNGANTTTKDAMVQGLRYEGIDKAIINGSYKSLFEEFNDAQLGVTLDVNNSIWIKEGENVLEDFKNVNIQAFDALIQELDFSRPDAADIINNWISEATKGKIEKMIDPPIHPEVLMYLINAIYFKGDWQQTFDSEKTIESDFTTETGDIKRIPMMNAETDLFYTEGEDYKAVKVPYKNEKTAMYMILPDDDINGFIASLDIDKWQKIRNNMSLENDVILSMPKFKIEYGIKKLKNNLVRMGMGNAFSSEADFSLMTDSDVYIENVLHKAVIEVNEEGSEAAAVTVVEIRFTSVMEPITFIANKPFIFMIVHEETGSILFMGKNSTGDGV